MVFSSTLFVFTTHRSEVNTTIIWSELYFSGSIVANGIHFPINELSQ